MAGAKVVGIHSGSSGGSIANGSARALSPALVQLRELSKQHLQVVLRKLFDSADDALFAMADNAGSNNEQSTYFDAMRELRLQKKHIATTVIKAVIRSYNELGSYRAAHMRVQPAQAGIEELSLVNNEELEIKVAVEGMVSRLRNSCAWPLECLHIRCQDLAQGRGIEPDQVPASPEILCDGFVEGCAELAVDIRAQLVVLKLFERFVLSDMPSFYDESNKVLVKQGIKPNIERGHGHTNGAQEPAPHTVASGASSASLGDELEAQAPLLSADAEITAENSSALGLNDTQLQELLGLLRRSQAPVASQADSVPTLSNVFFSQAELVGALDSVQAQIHASQDLQNNQKVVDYHHLLSEHWGRSAAELEYAELDADVMNLVSMLFEFFLEDRQLQPDMKALIGRLQIPILKVALMDRSFFARGGHPARKLLNEIASAALGWNPPEAGRPDRLKEKIESVVARVLADFGQDLSLFDDLLHEFSQFIDVEKRRGQLVEQRTKDSENGKAANVVARKAVQDKLNRLIKGHSLPLPVKAMLSEAWSSVMLLHYLKAGESSPEWQQACARVEQLLWTLNPEPYDEAARARLAPATASLNEALEVGMKDLAFDEFKVKAWLSALSNIQAQKAQELDAKLHAEHEGGQDESLDEEGRAINDLLASTRELEQDFQQQLSALDVVISDEPQLEGFGQGPAHASNQGECDAEVNAAHSGVSDSAELKPQYESDTGQGLEQDSNEELEQDSEEIVLVTPDFGEQDESSIAVTNDDPFVKQVEHFVTGCWFEFDNEGQTQRCKLAAIIKSTGKYIFVNRAGVKVTEKTKMGLAVELRRGSLQVLNDGLLFDRALESIITSLRGRTDD